MINNSKLTIIIAVFTISFIGYNVLTVDASTTQTPKEVCEVNYEAKWKDGECQFPYQEGPVNDRLEYEDDLADMGIVDDYDCSSLSEPDDYFHCDDFDWDGFSLDREHVDELCDASEDYETNKKNCAKAYALVEAAEERTAKEDVLCDNEDADTTDIKLCMTEDRLKQAAFNIDKDECKEANGEWKKDRCTYYEDEQQRQEDLARAQEENQPVVEDWQNQVYEYEEEPPSSPPPVPEEKGFDHGPITFEYKDEELEEQHKKEIKEYNESVEEEQKEEESEPEEEESNEEESEEESDDGGEEESSEE